MSLGDGLGLGSGGQQIQNCRKSFTGTIELLIELANLQTAFMTLDEALKVLKITQEDDYLYNTTIGDKQES